MAVKVDTTRGTDGTETAITRLSGLRPLIPMPEWGFPEADPASPVPAQHIRTLFCDSHETVERCGERIRPKSFTPCGSMGGITYPEPFLSATGEDRWPPPPNFPPKCTLGVDRSQGTGDDTPGAWLPFEIELPRSNDLCEDQTGAAVRSYAVDRLRQLVPLAILRQLWGSGARNGAGADIGDPSRVLEPRSLTLQKIAVNTSEPAATTPLAEPYGAWGTLVRNIEHDDETDYTIVAPSWAAAHLVHRGVVARSGNRWVDPNGQPVVFGGQVDGWAPVGLISAAGAAQPAEVSAVGNGYMVGCGPIWFAIDDIVSPEARKGEHPTPAEALAGEVVARPTVKAIVMTRTCNVYAVNTQIPG